MMSNASTSSIHHSSSTVVKVVVAAEKDQQFTPDLDETEVSFNNEDTASAATPTSPTSPTRSSSKQKTTTTLLSIFEFDRNVIIPPVYSIGSLEYKKLMVDVQRYLKKDIKSKFFRNKVPNELRNDKAFMLEICRKDGTMLEYATSTIKSNRDVVVTAIRSQKHLPKSNVSVLKYASPELQNDKYVVLEGCKYNSNALCHATSNLKSNKQLVIEACSYFGHALCYTTQQLKGDVDVVRVAVKQTGGALRWASPEIRDDDLIVLDACQQDGFALQFASKRLRSDKLVVAAAATYHPDSLKYALGGLKNNTSFRRTIKLLRQSTTTSTKCWSLN